MKILFYVTLLTLVKLKGGAKPVVTLEELKALIAKLTTECKKDPSKSRPDLQNAGKKLCPIDFDLFWHCWPQAEAGTSVELGCKKLFFVQTDTIKRRCYENGTWEKQDTKRVNKECERLPFNEFLIQRERFLIERGFTPEPRDHFPCLTNNGGCEQICRNTAPNVRRCFCNNGYKLKQDGISCEVANLPNYTGPTNEPITVDCPGMESGICYNDAEKITPKPDGNYPLPGNPKCFVQCVHGFPYCQCCNPTNLFFVQKCNRCMIEKNPEKCPETNIVPSVASTTKKANPKNECTKEKADKQCNKYKKEGYYHTVLEQEYIACTKFGNKFIGHCMKCPTKLRWVSVTMNTGYCDW